MLKIEYQIKLNERGRPYIDLSEDYEDKPEDKFFVIELSRYFLQNVYMRRSSEFDKETSEALDITTRLLGQIGDEMAHLIYDNMMAAGEMQMMLNEKYHVIVNSLEERDNIGDAIVHKDVLFKKQNGLKVFVVEDSTYYQFQNENWVKLDN